MNRFSWPFAPSPPFSTPALWWVAFNGSCPLRTYAARSRIRTQSIWQLSIFDHCYIENYRQPLSLCYHFRFSYTSAAARVGHFSFILAIKLQLSFFCNNVCCRSLLKRFFLWHPAASCDSTFSNTRSAFWFCFVGDWCWCFADRQFEPTVSALHCWQFADGIKARAC